MSLKGLVVLVCGLLLAGVSWGDCRSRADVLIPVTLKYVYDGETALFSAGGGDVKVRYFGVDTPESEWKGRWPAQRFSGQAKKMNQGILRSGKLTVRLNGEEDKGRCIGEVFVDGKSVSVSLAKAGLAWWYKYFAPDAAEIAMAVEIAKRKKKGLWADRTPEAPWDYRRRHKN